MSKTRSAEFSLKIVIKKCMENVQRHDANEYLIMLKKRSELSVHVTVHLIKNKSLLGNYRISIAVIRNPIKNYMYSKCTFKHFIEINVVQIINYKITLN